MPSTQKSLGSTPQTLPWKVIWNMTKEVSCYYSSKSSSLIRKAIRMSVYRTIYDYKRFDKNHNDQTVDCLNHATYTME
jgi:hypothetical protein